MLKSPMLKSPMLKSPMLKSPMLKSPMLKSPMLKSPMFQQLSCLKLCALVALAGCALSLPAGGASAEGQAAKLPSREVSSRELSSGAVSSPAVTGSRITATFQGLRDRSGYLRVSLYDRPDGFPNGTPIARRDLLLQSLDSKLSLDMVTVTFEGLPPGTYAVCAFHDRNGSGKLTQNFLGIPQEEWGMSGNPRVRFRAPRFDQAHLSLSTLEAKTVSVTLHI